MSSLEAEALGGQRATAVLTLLIDQHDVHPSLNCTPTLKEIKFVLYVT